MVVLRLKLSISIMTIKREEGKLDDEKTHNSPDRDSMGSMGSMELTWFGLGSDSLMIFKC